MVSYVTLYRWTDQGAKDVKDTVNRARQAVAAAEKGGAKVKGIFWTQGQYDLIAFGEWPDEASAIAFNMSIAKLGNLRTETLRALSMDEMESVLKKIP